MYELEGTTRPNKPIYTRDKRSNDIVIKNVLDKKRTFDHSRDADLQEEWKKKNNVNVIKEKIIKKDLSKCKQELEKRIKDMNKKKKEFAHTRKKQMIGVSLDETRLNFGG